jgi:hypothetical protein
MSYGLNVEMHKQMEIAKRLNAIIAQLLPYLSQEVSPLTKPVSMLHGSCVCAARGFL